MQSSFMSPKRFGKTRLAPRKKPGVPGEGTAAANAEPGTSLAPQEAVKTPAPARQTNSPRPANASRPANGTRQPNPPKQANTPKPANAPKPANTTKQVSTPKPATPAKPAVAPKQQNAVRQPQPAPSGTAPVPRPPQPRQHRPSRKNGGQARAAGASLKVIPLGGMHEIGKNMFVMEYENDIIIVDCGVAFPEENMPGIDLVIPDMSYVYQNKAKVRGIFFTHGHEDHIGAISWLAREVQAPVYGSKLTISLIKLKLEDRGGPGTKTMDLHSVEDGDVVPAGKFSVEFVHTNHSIADANLLVIRTPLGTIIHTGDFKIDYTPVNGTPIDLSRIASIGQEKPLLLLCESTNVEKPGFSMSESKVGESFANIFEKAPGRIFVATFSSNISRMQQIFTAAERFNRKVCLIGRSIVNVFNAANALGYINMKPGTLIDLNQVKSIPDEKLVIISTGSQGEPMSALTRIAFSEHQKVEIQSGDTVIISASPIPGNEKPIYRVINELFLKGANVIYASLAEVHASGHACQEELKLMHQLVRPQYFIPVHGEYRMLYQHAQLAQKMGIKKENSFILNNGDVWEFNGTTAKISGYLPADDVLIDGSSIGGIGNLVLRDRKLLADDGVISVAIAVDRVTGTLAGEPDIQARGFIYEAEAQRIIDESKNKIFVFVKKCANSNKPLIPMIKSNALRDQLRDFLFDRTRRRPIVIVSLIEV